MKEQKSFPSAVGRKTKHITYRLTPEDHQRLDVFRAQRGVKMQNLIDDALAAQMGSTSAPAVSPEPVSSSAFLRLAAEFEQICADGAIAAISQLMKAYVKEGGAEKHRARRKR